MATGDGAVAELGEKLKETGLSESESEATEASAETNSKGKKPAVCGSCHLATNIPPRIPLYGPYNVRDLEPGKLYLWCSCGLSKNQPFCDGSHPKGDFKPVSFKARATTLHQLCGCKYTRAPPFCDGTHIHMEIPPKAPPCRCPSSTPALEW